MKKKYILNGKIYYEDELTSYAKKSNLSLGDYIKESGAKEHNDTSVYTLNGKEYDGNTLADYAKQSDLPFDSYLKESGAKKKIGGTPSPVPQEDLSKTIPQVSLEKPEDVSAGESKSTELNDGNVPQEKTPPDVTPDVIDKILLANQYASDKTRVSVSGSTGGAGVSMGQSKEAAAEEKRLKEELKSQGYDVDELTSIYADLPKSTFNSPGYSKQELAQLQKDNPQEFERKIATAKWSIPLQDEIRKGVKNGDISQEDAKIAWDNIHKGYNSKLSYEEGRQQLRDLINDVDKYASSDTKDKIKNNLAQSFAIFYGNSSGKGYTEYTDAIKNDPNSKFLDENQLTALHFLQDTEPKKAEGYSQLLTEKPSQWLNEDAELGWEEKAKNLEQIGLGLNLNASKEKLNQLIVRSKSDQVFPEDREKAQDLLANIDQINQQLQNLDSKYPNIQSYDTGNAAKDITGYQGFSSLAYAPMKAQQSIVNTVKGLWDLVSRPFRSEENNRINQLEIAGENIKSQSDLYIPKDKTTLQQYDYKFAPELDKQIKDVMSSKSSDEDKFLTVDRLLRENPQDWSKVPIKNGKVNISPASIWYGVSDLAATLVPFIAAEAATGGGATAGLTRKLVSSFTSAFATSFHDTYAEAIRQGVANPYGYALRVTGINAAAMTGAGTAAKVKEMVGTKTAAGQLINQMDDKAIDQIIKSSKRSAIKDFGIQNLKNVGKSIESGVEFEGIMGVGKGINQTLSGEKINPEQMMIQGAVGVLNFGAFGTATSLIGGQKRTVTELQSSTLLKASQDPAKWIASAKEQLDNGNLSLKDYTQIKKNIETASQVSKNIRYIDDNGNPMSERKKAEYLALKMQEVNLNEEKKGDVPQKFEEKINTQLEEVKTQLQNITVPEKEEGKEEVTAEEAKKLQKSEYVVDGKPVTEQEFLDAVKNTPDKEIQYTGTNDEYIKMVEKIGGKTVEYFWNDDIAAIPEVDSKVKQLNALIAKGGKEGEDAAAELDLLQQDPEKYFSKDKAIVDKIKSTYEETPVAEKIKTEVPKKTEYETRQEEEDKLYRLREEEDRAIRRIATADDTDAAIAEWNKAKKERNDFEASMDQRQKDIKDKNALEGLIYDINKLREEDKGYYKYTDLHNKDPRLAALQHAKDMLNVVGSDSHIEYLRKNGESESDIKRDTKRSIEIYTEDIDILERDLKKNPVKETKKAEPEVKQGVPEVKKVNEEQKDLTPDEKYEIGNILFNGILGEENKANKDRLVNSLKLLKNQKGISESQKKNKLPTDKLVTNLYETILAIPKEDRTKEQSNFIGEVTNIINELESNRQKAIAEQNKIPTSKQVKFRSIEDRDLTGEAIDVPTHENLDLILVKTPRGATIYERATGAKILETNKSDKAEVIEEVKKHLDSKGITAGRLYDRVLKEEPNKINPKIKVINKSEKYNAHKEQKIAEQKNQPLLYSEDEINKLQKYKEEADAKGLTQSSKMIENMLTQRQTKTAIKIKEDQIRKSLDKEQENKTIAEFKKKNEPLPDNLKEKKETTSESLWNSVSSDYKTNQLGKISEAIKRIAEKAWQQQFEIFNLYGYYPESMPSYDISNKNPKIFAVLIPLSKIIRAANGKDPKKVKENVAKAEAEVREAAANMDKIYEEEMAKFGKKVAVPEKIGLEGRDESVTLKEMKPFTDKMVEIERQLKNEGYDIDWDYDNEVQILDKDGEQVDAEELPNKLVKLAAAYEAATKKLADYDQKLYIKSLKESRKVVETEAEVVTPAKKELPAGKTEMPKEISDLYLEAASLRITLNALKMQMGGKELKGKSKVEYDNTKARLDNIELKLSEYEESKKQKVEPKKEEPKKEEQQQLFKNGETVNYYDDLYDKTSKVKILFKTGDAEDGTERYQVQFEDGTEASIWSDKLNTKEAELPKQEQKAGQVKTEETKKEETVPEVQKEEEAPQFVPLKVTDLEHEKITRDNAIDYEEDEKEGSNGRMYTYTSSITIEVTNQDGETVGNIIQKKDEEGDITWESQDFDGNDLSKDGDGFNFKDEAMEAIVKAWNKEKKKEFDREAKKALKAKEKAANNKKVKKSFQLNTNENLSEDQAEEVAAMFDEKLDDADSIFPDAVTVDGEIDPSVPMQTINVNPKDKRPEGQLMSKLRVPLKFILGKKIGIGMSDTLTTGERTVDTLNPKTNKIQKKKIREEGGIGYPFKSLVDLMNGAIAAGKKAMGWAAVGKGAASAMINAAKQADKITGRELKDHYFESLNLTDAEKAKLEEAIPDNKEYGLVAIYKMGDDGIKSNEAYSAEAIRQIETKLNEAEKKDFFKYAIDRIEGRQWKGKAEYLSLFKNIKTFAELDAILHGSNLPLGTKADILTKVILSTEETVSTAKNPLADLLKSKGITIESVSRAIEEPVMKGIDKGQLMILLAIDPDAKSVEDKGRERHKNYPYGVEGFPIGVFDQTTQFHHLSPEMMDTFIKTATATLQSERSKEGQVISMTSEKDDKTGIIIVKESKKVKVEGKTGLQTITKEATDKNGNPITGTTAAEINKKLKDAGYKVRITISQKSDGKFYAEEGTGASKQSIFDKGKPLSADSPEQLFAKLKELNIEIADDVAKQRYTQKINGSNYGNLLQKAKKGLIQIFKSPQLTAQQKLVKVLQKAFPGIIVEMNQQQYNSMEEMFKGQALINKTGKTYGFLHDGRVYLDPTYLDNNLPIHEYGHVWNAIAREYRKDIYNKGVDLVSDSNYFDFVLNDTNYKRLLKQAFGNDIIKLDKATGKYIINEKSANALDAKQYVADEALSKAIGDRGQLFVDQAQKLAFVKWLEALYNAIKKIIGFENMTPEQFQQLNLKQFVDAALKELLSGKPISDVTSKKLAQITKESGTKFSIEENKEPEGVGISKAKLLEQYGFKKGFDTRESQDVAMGVMNTINNAAKKNNLTPEQQTAYEVTVMRSQGSNVAPTDHNIITAGKHLLDIDKKIKDAMDANDNNQVETLLRQRDEASALLRQLGNNAGRNLGLFALIFNSTSDSELTVTRYGIQRALGVTKVPETTTELENSNLTAEEKDKIRPYVQEIEKLKKQIADIEEEMKNKVTSLNDEELKKTLKEAYEQGRKAGMKFMSGKKDKKSQQLKDLASKLRSSDEMDKFIANMQNVQKKGIDLGSYKEILANILEGVAAVVEAGENINEYLRKAVDKVKDPSIDKKELLKDMEMLVARATLPPVEETLKKIKRIAKTEKAKSITESMVDKGLISDLIDTLIASEVPSEKIIQEVTDQLKAVLPNVTAEDVADAFVGRNQFKKESKQQLKTSVAQKKEELKRLTVKEEKLKALEAANNYHLAKTKEDKEKIRSDYEKELDARIQKAKFGEDLKKIKEEIDFINSNKTVFRKAIKNKEEASADLIAAREALRQTYIQNGLRVETGDKSPIAVEQAYQDQLKKIQSDSSLSDAEKTKKIAELKAQRDLDLIGSKQGVISNLTDSLKELINSNMDKANEAFLKKNLELAQYYNELNNDISDITTRLAPTGENLSDLINRAYRDLNKLAEDKSLNKEDRQAISDIIKELEFNNQLASDQLAALKLKKQWQNQIDAANTKINSGLYTEIPVTPFDFRRQAALSVMNRERQNVSGRLKSLVTDAKQKNKTTTEKAFDLSTKLLVSGAHTTLRVAEAATLKPFIDAIVENTTGRIASLFTGADAATLRSIKEGFKTFYAFKNKEEAAKYISKLEDIKVKALEDLESAHRSGDKKQIDKAEKAFLKADLNYAISTIYASIEANAFSSFWDYLAHGATDYDVEIGKGLKKKISDYRTVLGKAGYVLEGWIRMHGAEKSTISARPEMLRTFATTLQQLQSEGKPLNEENIAFAMVMAANAYDYGRLTNKTALSNTITQLKQSKYSAIKYPARFIFPVSTIAINIGKRAIDYSSLGVEGWTKLASETKKGMKLNEAEGQMYNTWMQKMKAGIEKIPLEQRKYINGVIARGLFGAATSLITLWGLANGQIKYGGTWDDQKKRKVYGSDGEQLKPNEWEFFGWKSPKLFNSFLLHTPEALNISLMANWYQINQLDKGKGTEAKDQAKASFDEVVARFPFMTVAGIFKDPLNTVVDRFTRIPLAKEIGDQFDENADKRDKSTLMNRIKSNVGLGGLNDMKQEKGGGGLFKPKNMRPHILRPKRP